MLKILFWRRHLRGEGYFGNFFLTSDGRKQKGGFLWGTIVGGVLLFFVIWCFDNHNSGIGDSRCHCFKAGGCQLCEQEKSTKWTGSYSQQVNVVNTLQNNSLVLKTLQNEILHAFFLCWFESCMGLFFTNIPLWFVFSLWLNQKKSFLFWKNHHIWLFLCFFLYFGIFYELVVIY